MVQYHIIDKLFAQRLGLSQVPTGKSGDVTINTSRLNVTNGGLVSVRNDGSGNGGTLKVNADSINLDNRGGITAATTTGFGGDISLRSQILQLRNNSSINATAGGAGNGGNLTIDAGALVQLENSNITANAIQGKGGNININTQGIFRSPDSSITASSQSNVNGIVNITTPDIKQDSSLQEQPTNFINAEQVVANSCLANRNNQNGKFVITGNGGMAETPDSTNIAYTVTQLQPVRTNKKISVPENTGNTRAWKLGDRITEAKELHFTPDGRIVLNATGAENLLNAPNLTCE